MTGPTAGGAPRESRAKPVLRALLAVFTASAGVAHFIVTDAFVRMVPRALPAPAALVYISGACEMAGSLGLLVPRTRRLAGLGLVLLYVAIFPANVNMAWNHIQADPAHPAPLWALWARLPFHALFMGLAWWTSRPTSVRAR